LTSLDFPISTSYYGQEVSQPPSTAAMLQVLRTMARSVPPSRSFQRIPTLQGWVERMPHNSFKKVELVMCGMRVTREVKSADHGSARPLGHSQEGTLGRHLRLFLLRSAPLLSGHFSSLSFLCCSRLLSFLASLCDCLWMSSFSRRPLLSGPTRAPFWSY